MLYERPDLPALPLPAELEAAYGGSLGFEEPVLVANFVSSLDGVVAIRGMPSSVATIRGATLADRFVMGLLRACADAVIMGATTFRASSEAEWAPESIFPPGASAFGALRAALEKPPAPALAVVTRSGALDPAHPALGHGAIVLTGEERARELRVHLGEEATVVGLPAKGFLPAAVAWLRGRGHRVLLTEGGPSTFTSLLRASLVDELFLTLSPRLAGRARSSARLGLVEGLEAIPELTGSLTLLSLRREESHLFARYSLRSLGS